jgi:hypothetical protein
MSVVTLIVDILLVSDLLDCLMSVKNAFNSIQNSAENE